MHGEEEEDKRKDDEEEEDKRKQEEEEEDKRKQEEDEEDKRKQEEEEEDKQEEEDKRKQEEDEEDKRKDDEEEEDKKKEEGEPKPGESEIKLPQAPAGETDEDAKPETGELEILEKKLNKLVDKKVNRILKSRGLNKAASRTPRGIHEVVKRNDNKEKDLAMDIIKGMKTGKLDQASVNRMVQNISGEDRREALKAFINKARNSEVA